MNIEDYKLISVQASGPPSDMEGPNWHCYIIAQGQNTVVGFRQGSLESVQSSVEEIVVRLNERRIGKVRRVQLDMSPRGRPAKTP